MNTYTVLSENETIMDNATIKQFLDYIEDTEQFENWFLSRGYTAHYARKSAEHFLKVYDRCIEQYPYGFVWADYEFILEEE